MEERGRSLAETPTWSVATVTTVLVAICFVVERSLHRFGKWLVKTKRKPLLAALEKIKEELMLLGLLSLILVQASRWVSTICVESKIYSSRFYPCTVEDYEKDDPASANRTLIAVDAKYSPYHGRRLSTANHCNVGYEPFVSYDSMEQLHRLLFVLGVTHVLYCCLTMLLALIKIYSWKAWEMEAHSKLLHISPNQTRRKATLRRQSTFVLHQTSHPWTRNKVLIWLLCFSRQFVRTVTKADYTTLRMGFITNHRLRFTYDFHSYMVRTMEDEFRDIVGISWQLWGYAILCIFFNLHGLNFYFWISFVPAILVLLLGTKIQHVMAKLALEDQAVVDSVAGTHLKPRDELFWFDKPELMLWLIQFISFQNAFEMAAFIWSWWQIKDHTCFMKNYAFVYTRLLSGLMVQFWCSYSILPLYAIVTQMGSRFKKALIAEEIRESLHGWRKRVRGRVRRDPSHPSPLSTQTSITSETVHTQKDDDENQVSTASLTKSPSNSARKSSLNGREISVMPECQGDDLVTEVQQEKAKELHILQSSFRLAKDAAPIELQSINIANDHQLANENERKDEGENILIEEPCEATWAAYEVQSLGGPVVQSSDDEEESDNEGKLIELENEPLYTNRDDESTDEEKGEKSWRINWLFESDRIMHGP